MIEQILFLKIFDCVCKFKSKLLEVREKKD